MEAINTINYFTLTTGVLELHFDKIVIFDDTKKNHSSRLLNTALIFLYGVGSIYHGVKYKDDFSLYFGIIISILSIFFILKRNEFKKVDDEINLKDISAVSFKDFKDHTIIAEILTDKKSAREIIIENNDNIAIRFMNKLKELNINVSVD